MSFWTIKKQSCLPNKVLFLWLMSPKSEWSPPVGVFFIMFVSAVVSSLVAEMPRYQAAIPN